MKLLVFSYLFLFSFGISQAADFEVQRLRAIDLIETDQIVWTDFESAVDANKDDKKPFFIDMYTDWCGYCRKMDASTFRDEKVVEFLNKNFHTVKMNPEKASAIAYKGNLYEKKAYGKKQYNELAVNMLGGKMSFPTFVILSKKEVRLGSIPGYQIPDVLISKIKAIVKIK
ncbi:thioredoxin family protein [Crocinitomix catalasitica]|nr:thioredoxin family protein [Crocinitomix catalasitica]